MSTTVVSTTPSRKRAFRKLTYSKSSVSPFKRRRTTTPMRVMPYRQSYVSRGVSGYVRGPIPRTTTVRLRYAESVVAGTPLEYLFNLNSIHDPNRSGTGHQPYGHDTLATLYNYYRVMRVDYKLTFYNQSSGINTMLCAGLYANTNTSAATTEVWREMPGCRSDIVPVFKPLIYKGTYYPYKVVGVSKTSYLAEDQYQGNFGGSPTATQIMHIAMTSPGGTTATSDLLCYVQLWYTCKLDDPKQLGQS